MVSSIKVAITPHEVIEREISDARSAGLTALTEPAAKRILSSYDIRVPGSCFIDSMLSPIKASDELPPPYALKVVSSEVLHKTDVGGVRLNLSSIEAVTAAMAEMQQSIHSKGIKIDGWLLEEMAPQGIELVVGGTFDIRFGPMIMLGFGGIFVELLKDVTFRMCPIDLVDARQMIGDLRGARLLEGWRGQSAASVESLERTLLQMGGDGGLLISLLKFADEVEINPLIVSSNGATAVDARIILSADR